MKRNFYQFFLLVAFVGSVISTTTAQTIFVNKSATGSNNGTSWANAFTSLDAAIASATATSEIWVAKGVYKPTAATAIQKSTFHVKKSVAFYGGFAGTETTLAQRNFVTNVTTLNGDLGANDAAGDYWTNRLDNCFHVVTIDSVVGATAVIIDGFTLSGARSDSTAAASAGLQNRGGAIQARSAKIELHNCIFEENWSRQGAGIWLQNVDASGPANGFVAHNCTFQKSGANSNSAGIFIENVDGASIENCNFKDHTGMRGGCYVLRCLNVTLDGCQFENGVSTGVCGGLYSFNSSIHCKNTTFKTNKGTSGGAVYITGAEYLGTSCLFENCTFDKNECTATNGTGGAAYMLRANVDFNKCTFTSNKSAYRGASTYATAVDGDGSAVHYEGCDFELNSSGASGAGPFWNNCEGGAHGCFISGNAASTFGGGGAIYGKGARVELDSCTYKSNTAVNSAGGISIGFIATATIKNCSFENNMAANGGGIYAQNDTTTVNVSNTSFSGNVVTGSGGGIWVRAGIPLTVDKCDFSANEADFGAAMSYQEDTIDIAVGSISNCNFEYNIATTQAAGINFSNTNSTIQNCKFANNLAGDGVLSGTGGCISNNATGGGGADISVMNCTFANNIGILGSSISQWEDTATVGSTARLFLQNTIFAEPFNAYFIEAGAPQVISAGGNLNLDASLGAALNGPNDVKLVDPKFVSGDDLHLQAGSPCINKGVANGAPAFDLDGLPRIGVPDKGCYEFQSVATGQPLVFSKFSLSPNPAADFADLMFENQSVGMVSLRVMTVGGQLISEEIIEKQTDLLKKRLDLTTLPQGAFIVSLEQNGRKAARVLVKK